MDVLKQLATNHARSPHFRDGPETWAGGTPKVRLIAFYLPQFHPIPENDAWWGKGFTEWTNVSKALPRFKGHYQPHLPGELGFYDLRIPQVLKRQAELMQGYGLSGFCFHHYWFGGKTLLDLPIRTLLNHPDINLPFCVNWANENWSRRWDGGDKELLIAQDHSPADDLAFAASLEPLFRDPRYIRINGRPLLMLYRPKLLPDATATVQRWRAHFEAVGLGNPYITMAQSFGDTDPRPYGLDAAAGFPPHNSGFNAEDIQDTLERFHASNLCTAVRYSDTAAAALANFRSEYRLFPGVCPGWDNEPRQPNKGFSLHGSTPGAYGDWLSKACAQALAAPDRDERIVFINAWNEWGEGAHLEPDRHMGYAYLAETARVAAGLDGVQPMAPPPSVPAERKRRPLKTLPGLVVKNLAYHSANAAEGAARLLRKLV